MKNRGGGRGPRGPAVFQASVLSGTAFAFCVEQKSPSNLLLPQSSPAPSPPWEMPLSIFHTNKGVPRVRKSKGWLGPMEVFPDWWILGIMGRGVAAQGAYRGEAHGLKKLATSFVSRALLFLPEAPAFSRWGNWQGGELSCLWD